MVTSTISGSRTTATSVSTLVRTAARCSCRRRSDSAAAIWATVTPSPSHDPTVVIGPPPVTREEVVRLRRSPAARVVARQGRALVPPRVQDGVDDLPRLLDLVAADEEGLVADERVEQQPFVGLRRLLEEGGAVEEVHRDRPHLELLARDLGAEAQGDALVGLDAQDEGVRRQPGGLALLERQVRWAVELHRNLGDALRQALARAHVDRHAGPP